MSTHAVTRVRPVGEHKQRLVENIGEESWVYDGVPVEGMVERDGKKIAVYIFEWAKIPPRVQQQMVRSRAAVMGASPAEIRRFCETHPNAMPRADVTLEREYEHG